MPKNFWHSHCNHINHPLGGATQKGSIMIPAIHHSMLDNLKRIKKVHDGKANFIANILNSVFVNALYGKFKGDINTNFTLLSPDIDKLLETNFGVMLLLTYDVRTNAESVETPEFISLSIVSAGTDRWKVIHDLKQSSFDKQNSTTIRTEPKGCPFGIEWCKKEKVYIWFTRYFVEYLTNI